MNRVNYLLLAVVTFIHTTPIFADHLSGNKPHTSDSHHVDGESRNNESTEKVHPNNLGLQIHHVSMISENKDSQGIIVEKLISSVGQ